MTTQHAALLSAIVIGSAFLNAANAQDIKAEDATTVQDDVQADTQGATKSGSALGSEWSFGLQAAPLVFGLSLRHNFNNEWQVQGVIAPDDNDPNLAFRVLRTSTQKEYWQSYLFSGLAIANGNGYVSFNDASGNGSYEDYTNVVVTGGLGVEWAWTAKNPSLPPLSWSLELGLGFGKENYGNSDIDSDSVFFLAAGAGIHYQFE